MIKKKGHQYKKSTVQIIFISLIIISLAILNASCKEKKPTWPVFSPPENLAFNNGETQYPSPMASDPGWGEAVYPWHLVDGIRDRSTYWTYGLAFTGGRDDIIEPCGWRQATIEFGEPRTFNRVIIWHQTANTDMGSYSIRIWDEISQNWKEVVNAKVNKEFYDQYYSQQVSSIPLEDTFPTVCSSKVQFRFNNCMHAHGWLHEFEVYNDLPEQRPECLLMQ